MNEDLPVFSFDIHKLPKEENQEKDTGCSAPEHVIQALLNYSAALLIKNTPQGLTIKTMLN